MKTKETLYLKPLPHCCKSERNWSEQFCYEINISWFNQTFNIRAT